MIQVILLSFREYFEAFLLITGFSVLCHRYGIHRTKEITAGAVLAFLISVSITVYVLATGDTFLKETQTDYIEGWLLLTSSLLITLFAFPFHRFAWKHIEDRIPKLENRIKKSKKAFDFVIFFFVFLLVFKEGMEALMFTAGATLSSSTNSIENVVGLVFGFFFAAGLAFVIRMTSLYLHVEKVFGLMALFVLLGMGSLFQQGIQMVLGIPYFVSLLLTCLYCWTVYVLFINFKEVPDRS